MRALEDTIAVLGKPALVRRLGAPSAPVAAIARWRHGAAIVDVAPSDTIRLTMSLVDGRNAGNSGYGGLADRVRSGSISIFSPAEGTRVAVSGEADVLQLFVRQAYAEATLDTPFTCPPMFDLRDERMQAMIARVLVGSVRHGPDDALMLEEDLHALILRIELHATRRQDEIETSSALFRGGLAPAAFRRVDALIANALDEANSPTLAEMANTARLSVTHFIRAFRRHTGSTPHKYLVRRRMERAISLLRDARTPIAEVSDRVGFSTPAHFVATFRAAMGVTPGAVRDALAG